MLDLFKAIYERRSIRKYQSREISKQVIEDILAAAGWAPSAHNAQPWRFLVLANNKVKQDLALAMAEAWASDMAGDGITISEDALKVKVERFTNAPVLILACLTMDGMRKFPDQGRQNCERDLAMQSLGAAIENLLLAGYGKGLGGCWFCAPSFCKETVRKVLKIPFKFEPQALVTLGYPAEEPILLKRKRLYEYCFMGSWGKWLA